MRSDSEIVRESLEQPAAFSDLYERHARVVHRYASRRLDAAAADDIMSETFLVAFDRRSSFDLGVDDARPWLLGIATRLIRKSRRIEARMWRSLQTSTSAQDHALDDAADRIDARRAVGELARRIGALSAPDRDTLLLSAWGDLDYAGVAHALGVPVGTVKSRMNRIRRLLSDATTSEEAPRGKVTRAWTL